MFTNILKKKRLLNGEHVEVKHPEMVFYDQPLDVLDSLYVIYIRSGKGKYYRSVLEDFIGGKYGINFPVHIQIQAVVRAMILFRDDLAIKDYYFKKALNIIKKANGIIKPLSQHIKNVINIEIGNHYLEYYNNRHAALESYNIVSSSVVSSTMVIGVNMSNNKILNIIDRNINGVNNPPAPCYSIDDVITIGIGQIYQVLRVGFIIHATEKGTKTWFRWNSRNRFKELFVLVVEMYSQLKRPLCGSDDETKAINEFLLTFTNDPPVLSEHNVTFDVIERKYDHVRFDRETFKFDWYSNIY